MSKLLILVLKQNYFGDTAQNLAMLVIHDVCYASSSRVDLIIFPEQTMMYDFSSVNFHLTHFIEILLI